AAAAVGAADLSLRTALGRPRITYLFRCCHVTVTADVLTAAAIVAARLTGGTAARRGRIAELLEGVHHPVPADGARHQPAHTPDLGNANLVPHVRAAEVVHRADGGHARVVARRLAQGRAGLAEVVRARQPRRAADRRGDIECEALHPSRERPAVRRGPAVPGSLPLATPGDEPLRTRLRAARIGRRGLALARGLTAERALRRRPRLLELPGGAAARRPGEVEMSREIAEGGIHR